MHLFNTKLPGHKPMLRQMKWWVQNAPIIKSIVLPVTALFFENFISVEEPVIKI